MRVFVSRKLPVNTIERLTPVFQEVRAMESRRPLAADELKRHLPGCEVGIVTLTEKIDESVLSMSKELKCLITFSVGIDHLDLKALRERSIKIVHTPNVLTDATADLTWALILSSARWFKAASRFVEDGKFVGFDPVLFLGNELKGATLGIVGFGKIGQAVAQRAVGFGMRVLYCGSRESGTALPVQKVELAELLSRSDVVTIHCPLKPETHHLIGRKELASMKKNAVLVNTARGPIVDEATLVTHLRSNPEFRVGLDVFEFEPKISESLLSLPNAITLPHLGSATTVARQAMADVCLEEAIRFAKGEALRYEYRNA